MSTGFSVRALYMTLPGRGWHGMSRGFSVRALYITLPGRGWHGAHGFFIVCFSDWLPSADKIIGLDSSMNFTICQKQQQ